VSDGPKAGEGIAKTDNLGGNGEKGNCPESVPCLHGEAPEILAISEVPAVPW